MSNFMLLADTAAAQTTFCTDSANIWQLVGYVLLVFKIVIPILLIIFGMIDLWSAVVAGKDDEVKKNVSKQMKVLWLNCFSSLNHVNNKHC